MSKNKSWYVTGASKGLGLALVKKLLADGYNVVATSRNKSALENAVGHSANAQFIPIEVDLKNPQSVADSFKIATKSFGQLDVIVNNAGYGIGGTLEELNEKEISDSFDVNLFGVINVIQQALPYLRAQHSGHIINISSMFGFSAGYGWSVYSSSKFAVTGLSEGLAKDLKPLGIHVTTVSPGGFRTNFLDKNSVAFPANANIEDYKGIHDAHAAILEISGKQPGDPDKAAKVIIDLSAHPNPPVHICLGSDSYQLALDKINEFATELDEWKEVSFSTDYNS